MNERDLKRERDKFCVYFSRLLLLGARTCFERDILRDSKERLWEAWLSRLEKEPELAPWAREYLGTFTAPEKSDKRPWSETGEKCPVCGDALIANHMGTECSARGCDYVARGPTCSARGCQNEAHPGSNRCWGHGGDLPPGED